MTDMEMVMRNGLNLGFVKKQTEEICLVAVKRNPFSLRYVMNQTEKICLEADRKSVV